MDIYDSLKSLNIEYEEIEHNAIYSYEDAKKEDIASRIDGVECKNLFIKSKTNYYLVFIEATKKADLKLLAKILNSTRLEFASAEELKGILNLEIGSVTPLGILNDKENLVTLLLDKDLEDKKVLMHSSSNTKTISLYFIDLKKWLEEENHNYILF